MIQQIHSDAVQLELRAWQTITAAYCSHRRLTACWLWSPLSTVFVPGIGLLFTLSPCPFKHFPDFDGMVNLAACQLCLCPATFSATY